MRQAEPPLPPCAAPGLLPRIAPCRSKRRLGQMPACRSQKPAAISNVKCSPGARMREHAPGRSSWQCSLLCLRAIRAALVPSGRQGCGYLRFTAGGLTRSAVRAAVCAQRTAPSAHVDFSRVSLAIAQQGSRATKLQGNREIAFCY